MRSIPVLGLVLLFIVGACGGSTGGNAPVASAAPAASSAAATATQAPVTKLSVSYSNVIASNLPVWVAKDAGIFEKNRLDVDVQLVESNKGIAALLSNGVQYAHLGGSEILSAVAGGADIVALGGTVPVWPYVLLVSPAIKQASDLKGKKLGIAGVGGSYDIAARVLLPKLGLEPDKDVAIIPTGSVANATAALASGAVDATLSQPPDQLALEPKGFHVIVNMADQKLPTANTTIGALRTQAANRDVTQRYIDSIVEAIAKAKKDKAFAITTLGKWLKVTDQTALNATYDHYVGVVIPSRPSVTVEQFQDAVNTLSRTNAAVKNVDLVKIIDDSFVKSAIDRGVDKR